MTIKTHWCKNICFLLFFTSLHLPHLLHPIHNPSSPPSKGITEHGLCTKVRYHFFGLLYFLGLKVCFFTSSKRNEPKNKFFLFTSHAHIYFAVEVQRLNNAVKFQTLFELKNRASVTQIESEASPKEGVFCQLCVRNRAFEMINVYHGLASFPLASFFFLV